MRQSRNILFVIYRPSNGFLQLIENPTWLLAAVTITTTQLCIALFPVLIGHVDAPSDVIHYGLPLFILSRNLLDWFYSTLFILLCFHILLNNKSPISFKTLFSIVVHSNIIMVVAGFASSLLGITLWLVGRVGDARPLPILNLDFFLVSHSLPTYLHFIAQGFTVFTLWYLGVLTIGTSALAKCPKILAFGIGVILWLQRIGIQFSLETILTDYLRGVSS